MKREPKTVHATFAIEKSFPKPPSVVFHALSEPDKVRRWMEPGEHSDLTEFHCDFREGGLQVLKYRMGPQSPLPGVVITNEARFQSIAPDKRIVMASTMNRDGRTISASLITFELLPDEQSTDLIITHQGAFFEGSDGPEMRRHGWNVLVERLVTVVTAHSSTQS